MLSLVRNNDPRRKGRVHCKGIHCSLGDVVNMSGSGICVRRRGLRVARVGEMVDFTLVCTEGELRMRGKVARLKRCGLMRHELGVDFAGLSKEQERLLAVFARAAMSEGGYRRAM